MKFLVLTALLFGLNLSAETLTKDYFVKGMHCGGCESGVRASLIELGGLKEDQVVNVDHMKPDPKNQIGSVKLKFDKASYKGLETDCKLIKAVKKNPGYTMYMSKDNTNPCNL